MRPKLRALIDMLVADEPDRDDNDGTWCRLCKKPYQMPSTQELEPTPLCNTCAHEAAGVLAREVAHIYEVIEKLPMIVSAPILKAFDEIGSESAHDFARRVLGEVTDRVVKRGRKARR